MAPCFWKLAGLAASSLAVPAGAGLLAYWLVGASIFREFPLPSPFDLGQLLTFDDSFQSFLFGSDTSPVQSAALFQHGLSLVWWLNFFVICAGIVIAAAVTATLYQHPQQVNSRRKNREMMHTAAVQPQDDYVEFLARCFSRLSGAIYFGATLLVVCVAHISAQYAWPAALLDPGQRTSRPKPICRRH